MYVIRSVQFVIIVNDDGLYIFYLVDQVEPCADPHDHYRGSHGIGNLGIVSDDGDTFDAGYR